MPFVQALKRLITTNDTSSSTSGVTTLNNNGNQPTIDVNHASNNSPPTTNGSQTKTNETYKPLSQGLQKKYAKGVQYNMKLIIRGECNTGKSILWSRLQGNPFSEDYIPSDEIRVATINWTSHACEDAIIKVEVWDVVDKSRKKRRPLNPSLKLANSTAMPVAEVSLDAEFLDVYKSTAGVLFVYDITKPWTWEYVEREIIKVPAHIPVLIIGNQLDMGHHRKVPIDRCHTFIEQLDRGTMGSVVRYSEASMRNGFGLQYIYQFLNIPFLQLQRESLLQQLQINARDMDTALDEIDSYARSNENDYETFIDALANKRRVKQEALAGDVVAKAKPLEEAKRAHDEAVQAAALVAAQQQASTTGITSIVHAIKKTTDPTPAIIKATPTTKQKPPIVAVQPIVQQVVPKSMSNDGLNDSALDKPQSSSDEGGGELSSARLSNPLVASTVDDFVPDDNDFETFLVDDHVQQQQQQQTLDNSRIENSGKSPSMKLSNNTTMTDDENETTTNPMVKGFCEQLDSDDDEQQQQHHHQQQIVHPVIDNQQIEYEPESPTVEVAPESPSSPPPPPIYHQISSSDLDFLDQMSSNSSKKTESKPLDTQSEHSEAPSIKSKKKKTSSKSKKDDNPAAAVADTSSVTKIKKKKKVSSSKTARAESPVRNHDDEDDLESFLGGGGGNSTSNKGGKDYELI